MGKLFFATIFIFLLSMPKIVITEIRDNYKLYSDLKDNRKSGQDKIIDISSTHPRNKNYLISGNILLKHVSLPHEIFLISEVRIKDYKYFHFILKCANLSETPFFRYDSDGPTHRNYDDNIPLFQQQITTPHFHCFNIDGISIAYKTDQLLNEEQRTALEDISLCVAHFFVEGNIRIDENEFPTITILSNTLGLTQIEEDPNAGVNFL